jgi:uncharacterized membrane protein YfcA
MDVGSFGFTIAGLIVGFIVGMTGVGGGSLMTPLLTLLFGVNPAVAVGTDLAFASATKTAGTLSSAPAGASGFACENRPPRADLRRSGACRIPHVVCH